MGQEHKMRDLIPPWAKSMVVNAGCHPAQVLKGLNDDESQPSQVIDLGMEDNESPSSTRRHMLLVAHGSNENLAASNRDNMVTAAGSHDNESLSTTIPNNNESPIPVTTQNEINGPIALEQQTSPEPEVSVPRYPPRNRNAPANLRDYDLSTSEGL